MLARLRRHPVVGVAVLLAVLALLLVYPAVLGGRVLSPEDVLLFHSPLSQFRPPGLSQASNYLLSDAVEVFHPDLEWARAAIRGGHLPLWDPYVFGGWPVFASQQTAILYPLNVLAYVLPFWQALGLIAVLKTLIAGVGTWWLCRRLRLGRAAALISAISFSLGSYFVAWLEHPHSNVYALIPWLLGAIDLLCARRRARDIGLLAALTGLALLGGHPESAFIVGLACLAWSLFCVGSVSAGAARWRAVRLLAGAVLLGVAAGAVMLVPFAELADQAPELARGGVELPTRSILSLVLPDLWGRPDGFELPGPSDYAERTFYVGALPLMLAVAGLYRPGRGAHRFFIGLLVGAGVIVFHVPVVTDAVVDAPGFSFVALDRSLILVAFSLALLAGFGVERLLGGDRRRRLATIAIALGVAAYPLIWLAVKSGYLEAFPRFSDIAPNLWGSATSQGQTAAAAGTRWLVFGLPGLAVILLLAWGSGRRRPWAARAGAGLAVVLVAADLLALENGYHPAIRQALAAPGPTPSIAAAQAAQGHGRTLGYDRYLIPNLESVYGLRDPRGHGLPALDRYLALWNGLGGYGFEQTRLLPADPKAADLLDEFAVNVVLTSPGERTPPAAALRSLATDPEGTVYRTLGALPRAYVATGWRAAPSRGAALRATLASAPSALRATPVIENVGPAAGPPLAGGSATFVRDEASDVELDVVTPRAGYLVLLDTYYPGWRATVDGRLVAINPANEAFRAVAIPVGRHRVEFTYRPASVLVSGLVSLLAWLAIAGLLGTSRLRLRRARDQQ